MHLPSAEKLWQIPASEVFPMLPAFPFLLTPLDVQATSYLAASVSIFNFSCTLKFSCINMISPPRTYVCSDSITQNSDKRNRKKNICSFLLAGELLGMLFSMIPQVQAIMLSPIFSDYYFHTPPCMKPNCKEACARPRHIIWRESGRRPHSYGKNQWNMILSGIWICL